MSVLDLDGLLAPVADGNPAGDDLEYDAAFMELERIARGKPAQEMGEQKKAAEAPDWTDVQSRAEALLKRTKDVRVAVHVARAALVRHALPGLADGLSLIARLLDDYWDGVYPRLDPDDDNDPTLRVNCVLPLADRQVPGSEPLTNFVGLIRSMPIVKSPLLGQFSFRDYLVATGEIPSPEGDAPPPSVSQIDGAFQDASLDGLKETSASLESALASVAAIGAEITERVGASYAPDLDWLQTTLRDMRNLVREHLSRRGVGTAPEPSDSGGVVVRSARGDIASREDVVAALERVCEYYAQYEPSSPVPFLLHRAQRLARMDFMEILRDMTPSGVPEAEIIGGIRPASSGDTPDRN